MAQNKKKHYYFSSKNCIVSFYKKTKAYILHRLNDDIVTSTYTTCARYKMEIGPDKTKMMTNNPDGFQREI